MIGEIRDGETAKMALRMALTGASCRRNHSLLSFTWCSLSFKKPGITTNRFKTSFTRYYFPKICPDTTPLGTTRTNL